jgi:hypothetical protein
MAVQKYGGPGGTTSAHAALLSDVPSDDAPADDADSLPTLEVCADDCDDDEVSVPFSYVAFSSPSPQVVTSHSSSSFIPPARLTSPRSEMTS